MHICTNSHCLGVFLVDQYGNLNERTSSGITVTTWQTADLGFTQSGWSLQMGPFLGLLEWVILEVCFWLPASL